jgi:hypothetical protein
MGSKGGTLQIPTQERLKSMAVVKRAAETLKAEGAASTALAQQHSVPLDEARAIAETWPDAAEEDRPSDPGPLQRARRGHPYQAVLARGGTSNWRPSAGCTGTTPAGCTATSATSSRRPSTKGGPTLTSRATRPWAKSNSQSLHQARFTSELSRGSDGSSFCAPVHRCRVASGQSSAMRRSRRAAGRASIQTVSAPLGGRTSPNSIMSVWKSSLR